jgi:hypothetical protein
MHFELNLCSSQEMLEFCDRSALLKLKNSHPVSTNGWLQNPIQFD